MNNCNINHVSEKSCCCHKRRKKGLDFYAQFGVQANPPSHSDLPLFVLFQEKNQIRLISDTEILLPAGYLYLIDYIFLSTPEANGFMEIIPKINSTLRLLYAFFAPAGLERNTSASGSFTTNEAATSDAVLSFNLTYPATSNNIDISGAISVTPLMRIR